MYDRRVSLLQEAQAKVDKLNQKLQEMREESDQVRRDCQAMIQAYQESQENKAHTLGTSSYHLMQHYCQLCQFLSMKNIAVPTAQLTHF
jgi:uncharacterized coiled-coil DUF342 family protein